MKRPKIESLTNKVFQFRPRKGDLKRLQILDLAVQKLAKQGIDNVSLDVLAKTLKTSRSHILYYFKDKDGLIDAVFQYALSMGQEFFIEKVTAPQDPKGKLLGYADAIIDWTIEYPDHARILILLYYGATFSARHRALNTASRLAAIKRIEGTLQRPNHEISEAIYQYLIGCLLKLLTSDLDQPVEKIRRTAHKTVLAMAGF